MTEIPKTTPMPPYAPFPTFLGVVAKLKATVVPIRMDRSMLSNLSGSGQTQVMLSLRFLNLISEDGTVQAALGRLVQSHGTTEWPKVFAPLVTAAYAPVVGEVDVEKTTTKQLADAFRAAGVTDGQMLDKAIRFWRAAMESAEIKTSPLLNERKPRSTSPTKRITGSGASPSGGSGNGQVKPPAAGGGQREAVLDPALHHWPVFIPGKPNGYIALPNNITVEDIEMIEAALAMVRAYAKRQTARDPNTKEAST